MEKTIVGLFSNKQSAENSAHEIRNNGFRTEDISILTKDKDFNLDHANSTSFTNDNISDGVTAGGILGGLTGLLIGAGTLAIPGLGILAGAGPIIGLLTGAVGGGLVGGLIDLGIPEEQSKNYETEIKDGKILFVMHNEKEENINIIKEILNENGCSQIQVY